MGGGVVRVGGDGYRVGGGGGVVGVGGSVVGVEVRWGVGVWWGCGEGGWGWVGVWWGWR